MLPPRFTYGTYGGPGTSPVYYEDRSLYQKLVEMSGVVSKAGAMTFEGFAKESEARFEQAETLALCLFGGRVTRQNIECLILATQLSAPAAALMIERVHAVAAQSEKKV